MATLFCFCCACGRVINPGDVTAYRADVAAAQARTAEIAERAAGVREYEFQRGIYAACLAIYGDPGGCNMVVAGAVEHKVYSDPYYSFGFEPPR